MLWLHEIHRVRGAHEEEFEAAFRDEWMPTLAKDDDARLLYFMHLAHGSGRAYVVTTITAVRDGAAWERIARRVQGGDLRDWARDVDQLRHGVQGKVLFPLPWSDEIASLDLADVPTDGSAEHELTIFMEDTAWPHDGMLEDYLQAAETQYAPSPKHGGRGLLDLQGASADRRGAPAGAPRSSSGSRCSTMAASRTCSPARSRPSSASPAPG